MQMKNNLAKVNFLHEREKNNERTNRLPNCVTEIFNCLEILIIITIPPDMVLTVFLLGMLLHIA